MDTVKGIPLDEFHLDERIYERSKKWASFMKQTSKREWEGEEECLFDEIMCFYGKNNQLEEEDHESADDLDSTDKSVELIDEVDEDCKKICDMSVLKLRTFSESIALAEKQKCSKFVKNKMDKSLPRKSMQEEPDKEADEIELIEPDVDIQKMVDQTLPVLVERERKWKESGMLRVLNTFDEKKIEEKVGTWLHNNSIAHNSKFNLPFLLYPQQANELHKPNYCARVKYSHPEFLRNVCISDTEEESLHSMDTARYIRSNRKPRNGTTMNIKTFRLLQSKRNALREKYSFPEDEEIEYHRNRITPIYHRHMLKKNSISKLYRPFGNKCEISLETTDSTQQQIRRRRKIFNKRRARTVVVPSCSTTDIYNENTSDDEEFAENKPFVANSYRRWCNRKEAMPFSYPIILQAIPQCDLDKRPQKRVSECCCYDEVKLCTGIRHLADTSTEEWFVENSLTPKKTMKKKIMKKQKIIRKEKILQDNSNAEMLIEKLKTDRRRAKNIAIGIDQVLDLAFETDLKSSNEIQKESWNTEVSTSKIRKYETKTKNTMLKIANGIDKVQDSVFEKDSKGAIETRKESDYSNVKMLKEKPKTVRRRAKDIAIGIDQMEDLAFENVCNTEVSTSKIRKYEESNKKTNTKLDISKNPSLKISAETKTKNTMLEIANGIDKVQDSVLEKDSKASMEIQKESCNKKMSISKINQSEDTNKKCKKERTKHKQVSEEGKKSIKKQKVNVNNDLSTSKNEVDTNHDSTFERDLSLAIKISSKLYEEEREKQKIKTNKDHSMNISTARKTQDGVIEKPISKTKKKKTSSKKIKEILVEVVDKNSDSNKADSDEETQILKDTKDDCMQKKSLDSIISKISTMSNSCAERTLKPQPKSKQLKHINKLKEKMNSILYQNDTLAQDATFFAIKNANICNSTAMANGGIAAAKELSSGSSTRSTNSAANNNNSKSLSPESDGTDCAVVSSTTCYTHSITNKGILLYTPKNRTLAPEQSVSNGVFNLTEEHLSSVIGEKLAHKFFKHHVGPVRFDANLSIFFRPPSNINNNDSSSDSDDDPLEQVQEHGKLYMSFND